MRSFLLDVFGRPARQITCECERTTSRTSPRRCTCSTAISSTRRSGDPTGRIESAVQGQEAAAGDGRGAVPGHAVAAAAARRKAKRPLHWVGKAPTPREGRAIALPHAKSHSLDLGLPAIAGWADSRPDRGSHLLERHPPPVPQALHRLPPQKNLEGLIFGGLGMDSYEAVHGVDRAILEPGKNAASLIVQLLETKDTKKRMPLDAAPFVLREDRSDPPLDRHGTEEREKPDETPVAVVPKKTVKTRKLDVVLPTNAVLPAGTLAETAGKLGCTCGPGHWHRSPRSPSVRTTSCCSGGFYGQVAVWDLDAVRPLKVLTDVLRHVNDLRFSPDGKLLAVAGGQPSARGDLRLYRVADWQLLGVLHGHDDVVFSVDLVATVSFSPPPASTKRSASGTWPVSRENASTPATPTSSMRWRLVPTANGSSPRAGSHRQACRDGHRQERLHVRRRGRGCLGGRLQPRRQTGGSFGISSALHWWNTETGEQDPPYGRSRRCRQ